MHGPFFICGGDFPLNCNLTIKLHKDIHTKSFTSIHFFSEQQVKTSKQVAFVPIFSPEWEFSFTFRLNTFPSNYWCNVMIVTNSQDANVPTFGYRAPSVYVNRNEQAFFFANAVNDNPQYIFYPYKITADTPYDVELRQRYISGGVYRYQIIINGVEAHAVNNEARQYYGVKIHVLGTATFPPCDGTLSNFKMTNFL